MPTPLTKILQEKMKKWKRDYGIEEEQCAFVESLLISTYNSALSEAEGILEETALADGFVGFSEEEWRGAKKILSLSKSSIAKLKQ